MIAEAYTCLLCNWEGQPARVVTMGRSTCVCPKCDTIVYPHVLIDSSPGVIALSPETAEEIRADKRAERKVQDVNFLANACNEGVQSGVDAMLGEDGAKLRLAKAPVVELNVPTTLPVSVERVLAGAADNMLTRVMVMGRTPDGKFYLAASETEAGTLLWDLEKAKALIMQ